MHVGTKRLTKDEVSAALPRSRSHRRRGRLQFRLRTFRDDTDIAAHFLSVPGPLRSVNYVGKGLRLHRLKSTSRLAGARKPTFVLQRRRAYQPGAENSHVLESRTQAE